MANQHIHADFDRLVTVDTEQMAWQASPAQGVWRKRLELTGDPEAGRVTSIVKYDAGARFLSHPHPQGEEFYVLSGTFSDAAGDYPAGSFVLNPEGYDHAPWTEEGCVLFVKLRQYFGRERIVINTRCAEWKDTGISGMQQLPLYRDRQSGVAIWLSRAVAGTLGPEHSHPGGEEVLVLSGELSDEFGRYGPGNWARRPAGSRHRVKAETDAEYYVKTGHLTGTASV